LDSFSVNNSYSRLKDYNRDRDRLQIEMENEYGYEDERSYANISAIRTAISGKK
jgi:hypothetical protein